MSEQDDIRRKLEEAGIPVGGPWSTTSAKTAQSPFLSKQEATLQRLEGLLERQIEEDQKKVAELGSALARLRRGGGS